MAEGKNFCNKAISLAATALCTAAVMLVASAVEPVNVPELMVTKAGAPVKDVATWEKVRRAELKEIFCENEYGWRPVAPRAVAIASASKDRWAGPQGEYYSAVFASPAWELYGKKGLVSSGFPKPCEARQEGMVSYHYRPGIHNLTLHDWNRYMDFADRLGWRK